MYSRLLNWRAANSPRPPSGMVDCATYTQGIHCPLCIFCTRNVDWPPIEHGPVLNHIPTYCSTPSQCQSLQSVHSPIQAPQRICMCIPAGALLADAGV